MKGLRSRATCDICGKEFLPRGMAQHKIKCRRENENALRDATYLARRETEAISRRITEAIVPAITVPGAQSEFYHDTTAFESSQAATDDHAAANIPSPELPDLPTGYVPSIQDIKSIFHPRSQLEAKYQSFEDFRKSRQHQPIEPEERPWTPFTSRLDFEFAELVLEAALSQPQIDRLIALFRVAIANEVENQFSIRSSGHVKQMWESASHLRTRFEKKTITVPYKNRPQEFPVYLRDPWDWALEIATSPMLASMIAWDPVRNFHWNGRTWERFIDEPWTAQAFWDATSHLNLPASASGTEAKTVAFILYSDKTHLSSFGTAKGYPIVARFGNLPHNIRNSDGIGGGRVVGWLPVVHEDTAETGKRNFTNFKHAVWHESFRVFLERVALYSRTGYWVKCGDGVDRWLWPTILILSADYEEMSIMTLIRGTKSLFPCPKCLVPHDQLSDLSQDYELRSQERTEEIVTQALGLRLQADTERVLKAYSLRAIRNAFWIVANTDLHRASSFDNLHFDDNGLWEDHFFTLFKTIITDRGDVSRIDRLFDLMPRWSGLCHFKSVMNITFNDGTKNRDISKVFLFAAQSILGNEPDSPGYYLLRCLRSYLNIRMYSSLDLQTEGTISSGERELIDKFTPLMKNITSVFSEPVDDEDNVNPGLDSDSDRDAPVKPKSWNFPKLHLRKHLFSDIRDKGVTRNYSTKPNEKMHRPLKFSYQNRSNFKNFADQILMADHNLLVAGFIRSNIDALDEHVATIPTAARSDLDEENLASHPVRSFDTEEYDKYRELGAGMKPCTFDSIEDAYWRNPPAQPDHAFKDFRLKLQTFLTSFLPQYNIPLPDGKPIRFRSNEMITEYRYLKIKYMCTASWNLETDYLRCTPKFHGQSRHDYVLVNSQPHPFFARLILLFTCTVNGEDYPIALIQPFDDIYKHRNRRRKDTDLELLRVRESMRGDSMFVSIHAFIRGALLVHSGETTNTPFQSRDYFVFDVLDQDMFLRARNEFKEYVES